MAIYDSLPGKFREKLEKERNKLQLGLNLDFLKVSGEIIHKFGIKIRQHHSDTQKILLARCFKRLRCPEYCDMALAAFFLCLQFVVLRVVETAILFFAGALL
jgi:hypothetical protein